MAPSPNGNDGRSAASLGDHAVVIGGSIAGLVCARVLSDHFARVTVIERDPRPTGPDSRKGAPQMRHVHALLEAASRGLEELFPGFIADLRGDGAVAVDAGAGAASHQYGGWRPRFHVGIDFILCSRPLVEWHLRRRIDALPNVTVRHEHTVEDLLMDARRERVTGVLVEGPTGEERIVADLVLDAAGRGTRVPRWLDALGYGRPEEQEVGIDLAYVSRLYERPSDFRGDWAGLVVLPRAPGRRGVFILGVEGGRWLVSMTGMFGDHCPPDPDGFLEFARSLDVPDAHAALAQAKPLTDPVTHKIPSSRWYHYETMKRFPEHLLLVGDSVCSLNPLYGQGITVSIQSALTLRAELSRRPPGPASLRGLSTSFQKKLARLVGMSWALSTTMDLRYPEATGKRPPGIGALQWTFANLLDLTSTNQKACRIFYELMHMRRGPEGLLHPDLLLPLIAYCAKSPFIPFERRVNRGPMPAAP
jgi:2-polyprenyl-6-methoxyphenol hydroxylase-like FAD-dependent oxidoreductase